MEACGMLSRNREEIVASILSKQSGRQIERRIVFETKFSCKLEAVFQSASSTIIVGLMKGRSGSGSGGGAEDSPRDT
jgi:hypothetical protein